jgi:nucleoside-diphosphate-sugar epimerase
VRIVVTGASGNVGTAVVEELTGRDEVTSVLGLCRRPHDWSPPRTEWVWGDVADPALDLAARLAGADVVIHLAWLFQPMRRPETTWRANVLGTRRVVDAVVSAGVPALVVASSVGAYSPRQDLRLVDESWPTHGVPQAAYSREKAYVERMLDDTEARHPDLRVVRMRPAFIFHRRASVQQRRLFLGPLVPESLAGTLTRSRRLPVLPLPADLRLQTLHTPDVARAYAAAALGGVRGAFNLASDPVLDPRALADLLGARWVRTPAPVLRGALAAAYAARTAPAAPELFDLLMAAPMMSSDRARAELDWAPRVSSGDAIRSFFTGLREHSVDAPPTPPLAAATSGWLRSREVGTGVGTQP